MKYKIGDKLLIKSKIIPFEKYELESSNHENEYKVCTSTNCGYDTFIKSRCKNIENGYVIHEVVVTSYINYNDGHCEYHVKNVDSHLSKSGKNNWQGITDEDVIRKISILDTILNKFKKEESI